MLCPISTSFGRQRTPGILPLRLTERISGAQPQGSRPTVSAHVAGAGRTTGRRRPTTSRSRTAQDAEPGRAPTGPAVQTRRWPSWVVRLGPGAAAIVYDALLRHGQVAISLPVAEDPLALGVDNWTTAVGMLYGVVLDPPPLVARATKRSRRLRHGLRPRRQRGNLGGYFIVRNSWGAGWASSAPVAGRRSPGSRLRRSARATYVDRYLWEWCVHSEGSGGRSTCYS